MFKNDKGEYYIGDGRYILLEMLGYGANGTVYLGKDKVNSELVAIKELSRKNLNQHEKLVQDNEALFHEKVSNSQHIISLHSIIEESDALYLVMEYCEYGDLFEFVVRQSSQSRLDNVEMNRNMLLQIISAVQDCHSSGVYHRDLKPENCMLTGDGFNIKLGDFGLATDDRRSKELGCGSACYMSPECHINSGNQSFGFDTIKNDVWSLGIILINVMCGLNPWKQACIEDESFAAYVKDPCYLYNTLGLSQEFYNVLLKALDLSPHKRCSITELSQMVQECSVFLREQELFNEDLMKGANLPKQKSYAVPSHILVNAPSLVASDDELYYSDSCYTSSSPTNPMFDILPAEPAFDKDSMYAMYFDETLETTQKSHRKSYLDSIEADC